MNILQSVSNEELRLIPSSTECARLVRCAAAEAFICETLVRDVVRNVFRDFYLSGAPAIGDAVSTVLDLLAASPAAQRCRNIMRS